MSDIALDEQMLSIPERAIAVAKGGARDMRFRLLTLAASLIVLGIFAGVMTALIMGSMPSIRAFGFSFVTSEAWNPVVEKFGALASIYGTIVTSIIAMVVAVPVGIGIAIFLTEICPRPLRRPIGIAIELLAGIPSIIYGIWGLFVFAPWFQEHVQTWIVDHVVGVPVLQDLLGGPPYGIGMFTAGLILSIMILPFISAVTRDVFETVPHILKEAAYGLGCTTWEVMWRVVLPFARSGVVGGAMLALGRALGETMAVTFVIGNAHHIKESLFAPATTISATIANEFAEAVGDLYVSSLIEMGLILFFITFIVLAAAQLMLRALERRAGSAS
ncbi:MAG TPA: phosphate ABC transporter permease subunit PstC [Rhizomicrobium sp.]|jgi:phosphate transport system permease protein|nr:phosphate ABC transporter permease subunit PstC [Rhizomicrobium sp.]